MIHCALRVGKLKRDWHMQRVLVAELDDWTSLPKTADFTGWARATHLEDAMQRGREPEGVTIVDCYTAPGVMPPRPEGK